MCEEPAGWQSDIKVENNDMVPQLMVKHMLQNFTQKKTSVQCPEFNVQNCRPHFSIFPDENESWRVSSVQYHIIR